MHFKTSLVPKSPPNSLKYHLTLTSHDWQAQIFFSNTSFLCISIQVLCDKVRGDISFCIICGKGGWNWRGAKLYHIIIDWPLRFISSTCWVILHTRHRYHHQFSIWLVTAYPTITTHPRRKFWSPQSLLF